MTGIDTEEASATLPSTPNAHLPERLAITLWDFTWYTRTGPGEPFADLDRAFAEAVERGYNTVRICAMPFLLFGSGLPTARLRLGPLGGEYGQRTRWYDVRHETVIDARDHLLALFAAARRHDCYVILSSWEYQQSPSFAADRSWWDTLTAVPPQDRALALADALADMLDFLDGHGLGDRVAFTELHNEVQAGRLTDGLPGRRDPVVELAPRLQDGVDRFKRRHPDRPFTVNYAEVPAGRLRAVPDGIDVAVFHPYAYGVLGALIDEFALRDPAAEFPQARAHRELLRPEAPDLGDWRLPEEHAWRQDATVVGREVYVHDWCDPERWDQWLYDRYSGYREEMRTKLGLWIDVAADFAAARGIPLVFGEGWVGYTPLHGTFEEGPVGADICRFAVTRAAQAGAWGAVVCSNAAPHHPMWHDVRLQRECNRVIRS